MRKRGVAHNFPGETGRTAGHQPGDGAGRVQGQAEAGEGRPQRSNLATEDAGVAEVIPRVIDHNHADVHADVHADIHADVHADNV